MPRTWPGVSGLKIWHTSSIGMRISWSAIATGRPGRLLPGVNGEPLAVLVKLNSRDDARAERQLGMISPVDLLAVEHAQPQLVVGMDEDGEHFPVGHQPPRGERLQAIEIEQAVGVGAPRPLVERGVDLGPRLREPGARSAA